MNFLEPTGVSFLMGSEKTLHALGESWHSIGRGHNIVKTVLFSLLETHLQP